MDIRLAGLAVTIKLASAASPSTIAATPATTTATTFAFSYRVDIRAESGRHRGVHDAEISTRKLSSDRDIPRFLGSPEGSSATSAFSFSRGADLPPR